MTTAISSETGWQALQALLRERSLLGPLSVLYKHVGHIFRIPMPSFQPFVVGGPAANRSVLVTERTKLRWRNADPVTDVLRRGVLVTDGKEHDHYRGLMEEHLHPSVLPNYVEAMVAETDRVSATWQDG